MADSTRPRHMLEVAAEIASAYVSHNATRTTDLPSLVTTIHAALTRCASRPGEKPSRPVVPAVPVKRSVTPNHLICLEDGKRFKSLKRHLRAIYGLTPEQYREKWNLPLDYPMVAPNYAHQRSALAKASGLGQRSAQGTSNRRTAEPSPASALAASVKPKRAAKTATLSSKIVSRPQHRSTARTA